MPPERTANVASAGGRSTCLASPASQRLAAGPAKATRVAPLLGSSRRRAIRTGDSVSRRPATSRVTGADVAARNASCAATSSSAVVVGSARAIGSRTGAPRSSDESAATMAAEAAVRSRRTPGRPGTTAAASPCRRRRASTAGRSTDAGDPLHREPHGRRVRRRVRLDVDAEQLRAKPADAAHRPRPAVARPASATAADQSERTPSCEAVNRSCSPPATKITGVCSTALLLSVRSAVASARSSPPTSTPAIVVPDARRVSEPANSAAAPTASTTTSATTMATRRAGSPEATRRRVVRGTLVAPEDTGQEG